MSTPEFIYFAVHVVGISFLLYQKRRIAVVREETAFNKLKTYYLKCAQEAQEAWDEVINLGVENNFFGAVELVKVAKAAKTSREHAFADLVLFASTAKYPSKATVKWVLEKRFENSQHSLDSNVLSALRDEVEIRSRTLVMKHHFHGIVPGLDYVERLDNTFSVLECPNYLKAYQSSVKG